MTYPSDDQEIKFIIENPGTLVALGYLFGLFTASVLWALVLFVW